ncbi:hypothetical protein K456DRAFT_55438 [Colletotrichum gloeosporioides 23]|nr:hypothetical protein K456DRAFT_55438 [Colletotrichum gloeosporioides 23]
MASVPPAENERPIRNFRRTYKACKLCRRKKIRCITDGPGKSCMRCKRELRECIFPAERSHHSSRADDEIRIPCEFGSSTTKDKELPNPNNQRSLLPIRGLAFSATR